MADMTTDCYQNKLVIKTFTTVVIEACFNKTKAEPLENETGCANASEHPKVPTASK